MSDPDHEKFCSVIIVETIKRKKNKMAKTVNKKAINAGFDKQVRFLFVESGNGFDYYDVEYKGKLIGERVLVRQGSEPVKVESAFLRNELVSSLKR